MVDDEQPILQLLRKTLELEGFAVTVAADGNSALARLAEQAPDLVPLDIRMLRLDGYQVLELIREKSELPVIMLTGANIRFEEICRIAVDFGFTYKGGRGSHRIFVRQGVREILNFQNVKGMVKPYQVRQFIKILEKYHLVED